MSKQYFRCVLFNMSQLTISRPHMMRPANDQHW